MNNAELIMLGAAAQVRFIMSPGFKIMFVREDEVSSIVRLAVGEKVVYQDHFGGPAVEEIRMELFGVAETKRVYFIGYGRLTNTLVVGLPVEVKHE